MRALLRCVALVCPWIVGCTGDLTQVVVVVDTNLAVPSGIDRVGVVVDGPTERAVDDSVALASSASLPLTLGLTPSGDDLGPVDVVATGYLGGAQVVSRRVRFDFVRGRSLMLRVDLVSACAGHAPCPGEETCTENGTCGSIDVDTGELPPWTGRPSGGPPGPSMDASVMDLGGPDAIVPPVTPPPPIDGGPPVDMGDAGSIESGCPPAACDPGAQTGCAAGQSCDIITSGSLICRPDGAGGDGTRCTNGLDCLHGYGCVSGGGPAECRRLCCAMDDSVCPSGQTCSISVGEPGSPYMACFATTCTPLDDTGCNATTDCYPRSMTGETICIEPYGTGMQGDTCDGNVNSCAAGHVCIETSCYKMCRFGGGSPSCPGALRCLHFGDFESLGLCGT